MSYVIAILVNLLALNFWIRLFQDLFHWKKNKRAIFALVVIMGVISACAMLAYPVALKFVSAQTFNDFSLSGASIIFLIIYIAIIGLLLTLFGKKISRPQKVLIRGVSLIGMTAGIVLGYITLPIGAVLYFLCIAGAEEFLKLSVGQSFFAQYSISRKDILLFAMLSAVGFALIENIVYLFQDPAIGLAISRNLTTVIMHILFTGVIAYIIMTRGEKNKGRYVIAFLAGMGLHWLYDTFMNYQSPFLTAAMIIIGYFAISYFFYKSDRLYLPKS